MRTAIGYSSSFCCASMLGCSWGARAGKGAWWLSWQPFGGNRGGGCFCGDVYKEKAAAAAVVLRFLMFRFRGARTRRRGEINRGEGGSRDLRLGARLNKALVKGCGTRLGQW